MSSMATEIPRCLNCGTAIDEQYQDQFCSDECRRFDLATRVVDAMDSDTLREAYIERLVVDYEKDAELFDRDCRAMKNEPDEQEIERYGADRNEEPGEQYGN